MSKSHFTFFTFLLFSALCFGRSNDFSSIAHIKSHKHLAEKALIYEDPGSELSLQNIITDELDGIEPFQSEQTVPYMDFTSSTYWMKLKVKNDSTVDRFYYIELARPLTNVVNLFVLDENNQVLNRYFAGDDVAFEKRAFQNRKFIFPIEFPAGAKRTLIVQTKSDGEILKLPIKFWTINDFTEFSSVENFFLGLYYGLFILVIVLFSFFGIALRQKLYVYFVSYVFFLGLFQFSLDGLSYHYFWKNSPWMGNHAILIFAAASMLAMLLYVSKFLQFGKGNKKYMIGYHFFTGLVVISLLLSLTSGTPYAITFPLLNGLSFLVIFYFLFGIYLKYRSGNKPEIAITIAFVVLCISAIVFIMTNTNVVKSEFLAANALKLGSAMEVTFLSMAMAIRYRTTQLEKEEAQEVAFKRLEELNQLKSEQTEVLEKEVQMRTQEIVEKNSILVTKNKEIINSINYAQRLQDAILPSQKLMEACFKEACIYFNPKDIVSGDFYWMEHTKTHVYFAVADCTGHGVPGAIVSVVGHNSLNRCINELKLTDPGEILDRLTVLVEHTFSQSNKSVSDGMDICLCSWDYKNELKYAGAYNPLYIIRNNELSEVKGNRQPIGKFLKREAFKTTTIEVSENDSVFLFSDGFADQFGGERGKKLRYSNFKNILIEANKKPISEFSEYLDSQLHEWRGEEEQIDDVCIMKVAF